MVIASELMSKTGSLVESELQMRQHGHRSCLCLPESQHAGGSFQLNWNTRLLQIYLASNY